MSNTTTDAKTQHTPGPWQIGCEPQNAHYTIELSRNGLRSVIADIYDAKLCQEHGDSKANARLIAAAPELLVCCLDMLEWMDDGSPDEARSPFELSLRAEIRRAIAKATGN